MTARSRRRLLRGAHPRAGWTVVLTCLGGAAVLALAGCTGTPPNQPSPRTGVTGTQVPPNATGRTGTGLIPPDSVDGTVAPTATGPSTAGAPATPEAAGLAWLSGPASTGVVVDTDAGRRWQGPVPGAWALLDDHGYSWFGPDGSMVGCASGGSCVAVDGSGYVAVTAKRKGPRLVYRPDGHFVGRFSADGGRMSAPASVPSLTHALADSGVDVPGLVNVATLGAPFAGGATGDPHLITAGGVRFTTQVAGQFVARGGDPNHAIQLQLSPMAHRKDVSVVSAVAIGTGDGHTITVDMSGRVAVDGAARPARTVFDQVTLPGGVAVGQWPATASRVVSVSVVWPDGGSVVLTANPALGMTVVAHLYPVAGASGLFGASGRPAGPDLLSRGGTAEDTAKVVTSWAVGGGDRLFASAPEPEPGFPVATTAIDPGAAKVATAACDGHGLQHAEDIAACSFDVALTGDTGFVAGHVELGTAAERLPVADPFAARWPALVPGTVLGAPDLPAGGRLSLTLGAGKSRAYRVTLARRGEVTLINRSGCGVDESPPGEGQPAMRLFDVSGHAVSDRYALCGHEQTSALPAGVYHLVVANGPSTPNLSVRVDVTLP